MIKVDLVTGILGAGKTTFIKKYVRHLNKLGVRVGILENDHGAVNVDMLMLNELRGDLCELEMVAGGCDIDCHKRRFKTKLISMAMSGYDRVVIEPSGVFDVDEFFDALRDEPLENWYEIGNVFCVVSAYQNSDISEKEKYLLASQAANAGKIIISGVESKNESSICADKLNILNEALSFVGCNRQFTKKDLITKDVALLNDDEYESLLKSGYMIKDYVKKYDLDILGFDTCIYFNVDFSLEELKEKVSLLFENDGVIRVKGFVKSKDSWIELNATANHFSINETLYGQDVLIVIVKNMEKEKINKILGIVTACECS